MTPKRNIIVAPGNTFEMQTQHFDPRSVVRIGGENNRVTIGAGVQGRIDIYIYGDSCTIDVCQNVVCRGKLQLVIRQDQSAIRIGGECTFNGKVNLFLHETSSVLIGEDCMFAGNILVTASDMHPIFAQDGNQRINPAMPIRLGSHVWVGEGVSILKGVSVGDGSVIGVSSVVTRGDYPAHAILAGSPAQVRKTGIRWDRRFTV